MGFIHTSGDLLKPLYFPEIPTRIPLRIALGYYTFLEAASYCELSERTSTPIISLLRPPLHWSKCSETFEIERVRHSSSDDGLHTRCSRLLPSMYSQLLWIGS